MDLVAGVRKEGSRGGRDSFKWEDVKDNQHRENYLGHSLMAPVGRWQKNKDLSWYAKGDDSKAAQDAAIARAKEIRRIKEAEQDALSAALGFAVEPRIRDSQLAGSKEVEKAIRETAESDEEGAKGVGFGVYAGVKQEGFEEGGTMVSYLGKTGELDRELVKKEQRQSSRSREREERHRRHRTAPREDDQGQEATSDDGRTTAIRKLGSAAIHPIVDGMIDTGTRGVIVEVIWTSIDTYVASSRLSSYARVAKLASFLSFKELSNDRGRLNVEKKASSGNEGAEEVE
ncbi:hypothetical protein MMC06_000337 [Schaereria dolodes]|nr:hypothetical protein [Schaereria dolodes]